MENGNDGRWIVKRLKNYDPYISDMVTSHLNEFVRFAHRGNIS
jgi:hypothetical protein